MFVQFNPAKHLYNRGWFGVIPFIGAFVGLHLLLLGVFKYRDKKLAVIGTAGILFTFLVYGSMYYYFNYSEQYRKDYAVFAQPYMNRLVQSIEFFKLQKGTYPDSLEQLNAADKMVVIDDPILFGKPVINKQKFYYKKMGEKYTLFSSGVDRIPYTNDDIFPSNNLFNDKNGLIRPK